MPNTPQYWKRKRPQRKQSDAFQQSAICGAEQKGRMDPEGNSSVPDRVLLLFWLQREAICAVIGSDIGKAYQERSGNGNEEESEKSERQNRKPE